MRATRTAVKLSFLAMLAGASTIGVAWTFADVPLSQVMQVLVSLLTVPPYAALAVGVIRAVDRSDIQAG